MTERDPFRGMGGRPTATPSPAPTRHKPKRPSTSPAKVEKACEALKQRIAAGEEFPEASWRVSQEFDVAYAALVAAYDGPA